VIAVIDSGVANTASILGALRRLGAEPNLTRDVDTIVRASRVILPGVGSAAGAMAHLNADGIAAAVPQLTVPFLGICLGMQLLYRFSEENGGTAGIGVFRDDVRFLKPRESMPVPHMGWTRVTPCRDLPLFSGIADGSFFYFVHSYAAPVTEAAIATADYGGQGFAAVAGERNFFGCQFHPERSSNAGRQLLKNFLEL
jgi:glutamine amidotransferase